jgi:hypothetical protein
MSDAREEAARKLDVASAQLERASSHCRVAARHFRNGEVPRGAAHAWAAFGHLTVAEEHLRDQARQHSEHAQLD